MKSDIVVGGSVGLSAALIIAAGIYYGYSQLPDVGPNTPSVADKQDDQVVDVSPPQETNLLKSDHLDNFIGSTVETEGWSIEVTEAYIDRDGILSGGMKEYFQAPNGYSFVVFGVKVENISDISQSFETGGIYALDNAGEKWFNNPDAERSLTTNDHVSVDDSIESSIVFLVPINTSFQYIVVDETSILEPLNE